MFVKTYAAVARLLATTAIAMDAQMAPFGRAFDGMPIESRAAAIPNRKPRRFRGKRKSFNRSKYVRARCRKAASRASHRRRRAA